MNFLIISIYSCCLTPPSPLYLLIILNAMQTVYTFVSTNVYNSQPCISTIFLTLRSPIWLLSVSDASACLFKRFIPVFCLLQFVSLSAEKYPDNLADLGIIVHDQHTGRCISCLFRISFHLCPLSPYCATQLKIGSGIVLYDYT